MADSSSGRPIEDAGTAWVLSSGSYSDYHVHCVVDGTEDEAHALATRINATRRRYDDPVDVEGMPVVSPDVQRGEVLRLTVDIPDDGDPRKVKEFDPAITVEWPFNVFSSGKVDLQWRWERGVMYPDMGRLTVQGLDHERVRKVYSDRKAMLLMDDALRQVESGGHR